MREREAAEAREAKEQEQGQEAAATFEALLEELKVEDGLVEDTAPETGLVTYHSARKALNPSPVKVTTA